MVIVLRGCTIVLVVVSWNKVRDYRNVRGKDKGSDNAQVSSSNEDPKKKRFFAIRCRGEQQTSVTW